MFLIRMQISGPDKIRFSAKELCQSGVMGLNMGKEANLFCYQNKGFGLVTFYLYHLIREEV